MIRIDIFDIPVYRLSSEDYDKEWAVSPENQILKKIIDSDPINRPNQVLASGSLRKSFGGTWSFNEIIGYIRLYVFGIEIRGEYFANNVQKHYKSRHKLFIQPEGRISTPGLELPLDEGNQKIFEIILLFVKNCKKELKKLRKKAYLDITHLERIGKYIDWKRMIDVALRT